mgnify:CR=1 FL=1
MRKADRAMERHKRKWSKQDGGVNLCEGTRCDGGKAGDMQRMPDKSLHGSRKEKPMKRTILKALKRVWKFVIEIFTPIIACGIAICLTILFIVQLFWGAVDAELAVLIVAYAVLFTAGICRELHTPSKEEVAKGIWVQLTTETMLFVAKGQMTQREAAHIMRAMRYVARKNGWEEAEEETGKA